MTTDNKTPSAVWAEQESAKEMQPFYKALADVQPGGRVRLATVPYDRARDLIGDAYNAGTHGIGYSQQAMELHDAIIPVRRSPATCKDGLQVQPSPGGQDALVEEALEYFERAGDDGDRKYVAAIRAALAARQPVTMDDALAAGDGTLHGAIDHWQERALRAEAELAARQPVGEPVDDHPPSLVDAAGMMAIESFLAVAEEFRRSAEPYIEPINEGGSAGDDEISEVFDSHLNHAKGAVSRSTICADSSAREKEGGQ